MAKVSQAPSPAFSGKASPGKASPGEASSSRTSQGTPPAATYEKSLEKDLRTTARALRIPEGSAEIFISRTIRGVKKTLKGKSIITKADLTRAVIKELQKYHADFAYVYEIRDIII